MNKAHRQRLEPRVFKDLFDLKENREALETMAYKLIGETGADRKLMELPDQMTGAP